MKIYLDADGTARRELAPEVADEFSDAGILYKCEGDACSDDEQEVYHLAPKYEWVQEHEKILDDIAEGRATPGQVRR